MLRKCVLSVISCKYFYSFTFDLLVVFFFTIFKRYLNLLIS